MSELVQGAGAAEPIDVGEYCRSVERHLTRVNGGHLVRIVGPAFELVKGWAEAGVPLSVVRRGIELRADRHRAGRATRPLRIEFCAGDVQVVFDRWRRAIGCATAPPGASIAGNADASMPDDLEPQPRKRPSLARHLDRAMERLSLANARVDLSDALRASAERVLASLAALRKAADGRRGSAAWADAEEALAVLDRDLRVAARAYVPADWLAALRLEAEADLAPFRARLAADDWARSIDITLDRLLRDRLGWPSLVP